MIPFRLIFYLVLGLHFFADFNLQIQGGLNKFKCKEWWRKIAPDKKYRNDYKCAMLIHSLFWAIVTFLPLLLLKPITVASDLYIGAIVVNAPIHYVIDEVKANQRLINLWTDQILHLIQIVITLALVKGVI